MHRSCKQRKKSMEKNSDLPLSDFLSVQLLIHGTRQLGKIHAFLLSCDLALPSLSSSSTYRQPSTGYKGRQRGREGERERERWRETHYENAKSVQSKKSFSIFLSLAGMSLTKLSLGGNYDVIYKLFLLRDNLVSDIPAGDGNIEKLLSSLFAGRWDRCRLDPLCFLFCTCSGIPPMGMQFYPEELSVLHIAMAKQRVPSLQDTKTNPVCSTLSYTTPQLSMSHPIKGPWAWASLTTLHIYLSPILIIKLF